MKKNLFLFVAAATCVACSMDETTEVDQGLPIDFRTAVATRAATINAITEFNVAAFYENGSLFFTEKETLSDNAVTTTHYWPTDNSEVTFYAYYYPVESPSNMTATLESKEGSKIEYTPSTTITDQKDLLTAAATGTKEANEKDGVALLFKHALSQIEVEAYYTGSKYTITVAGVKIVNVNGKGTYTFNASEDNYGTWESETTTSYDVKYESNPITLKPSDGSESAISIMGSEGSGDGSAETNGTWMLIPQLFTAWEGTAGDTDGTYLVAYIQIETTTGERVYPITDDDYTEFGWAAVGIDTGWDPNTKYTYMLHFTDDSAGVIPPGEEGGGENILGEPIKFTVTVDNWTGGSEEIDTDMEGTTE